MTKRKPGVKKRVYKGMEGQGKGRNSNRARGQGAKGPRGLDYLKPKKFKHYLTSSELALFVPCDPRWLKRLEADGRIPEAQRVPMGALSIRLWSPQQAEEIKGIIEGHQVGRPTKS
jgi:hypothetical protein